MMQNSEMLYMGLELEKEAAVDQFYNEANMERLERSIQKMECREVIHKSLDELKYLADE